MRAGGINWLAVIAAAVAVYAIGFIIYGMVIPEDRMIAMTGMTEADVAVAESRMALGILMPLATALFLAVLFKWGGVQTISRGAQWAAVVALASAIPTVWYGFVYGGLPAEMSVMDSAHLLLGHVAAGAILGGWR